MKTVFSLLILAVSLTMFTTAQASDRKIGNMIAVERTIPNVYQSCIDQIKNDIGGNYFGCQFNAKTTNADFSAENRIILSYSKQSCTVEAILANGRILLTFSSSADKADFTTAKACLRSALDASADKDSLKFIMYTVE